MTQKLRDTTNPKYKRLKLEETPTTEANGVMSTVPSLRSFPKPLEARASCAQAFVRTGPGLPVARRALLEAPNCDPALPPNLHRACARVSLRVVLCPRRCSLGGELCPVANGVYGAVRAQKQPRPGSWGRVRPPGRKSRVTAVFLQEGSHVALESAAEVVVMTITCFDTLA